MSSVAVDDDVVSPVSQTVSPVSTPQASSRGARNGLVAPTFLPDRAVFRLKIRDSIQAASRRFVSCVSAARSGPYRRVAVQDGSAARRQDNIDLHMGAKRGLQSWRTGNT
jgi:hypothetical protein